MGEDIAKIAAGLTKARTQYLAAVAASSLPYEPRHGAAANWALRSGLVDTVIRLPDGGEGLRGSFALNQIILAGPIEWLGQRLTPLGFAVRQHLLEQSA